MDNEIKEYLKDRPELINEYERREARYILSLPPDYETISFELNISNELLKLFYIALAEAELTMDEWASFNLKCLILSHKFHDLLSEHPELKKEFDDFISENSEHDI